MADGRVRAPQLTVRMKRQLREDVVYIAEQLGETDRMGEGISAKVRRDLERYRRKYRHLLDARDQAASTSSSGRVGGGVPG